MYPKSKIETQKLLLLSISPLLTFENILKLISLSLIVMSIDRISRVIVVFFSFGVSMIPIIFALHLFGAWTPTKERLQNFTLCSLIFTLQILFQPHNEQTIASETNLTELKSAQK
jgi:hypothetical protein